MKESIEVTQDGSEKDASYSCTDLEECLCMEELTEKSCEGHVSYLHEQTRCASFVYGWIVIPKPSPKLTLSFDMVDEAGAVRANSLL